MNMIFPTSMDVRRVYALLLLDTGGAENMLNIFTFENKIKKIKICMLYFNKHCRGTLGYQDKPYCAHMADIFWKKAALKYHVIKLYLLSFFSYIALCILFI